MDRTVRDGEAAPTPRRRRQWGSDRRAEPLPAVPIPVSDRRIAMARLAIVVTVGGWLWYVGTTFLQQFLDGTGSRLKLEAVIYLVIVTLLTVSALAYLTTRIGFFYRARAHRRTPRIAIDGFFDDSMPTLTVIVPSYQEDRRVIRATLLSAALQEYPYLRVVLLIDDPVEPVDEAAAEMLDRARRLPGEIEDLLNGPAGRFSAAIEAFESEQVGEHEPDTGDVALLAGHYEYAATWLRELAFGQERVDHADDFFADHVIGGLADDLSLVAAALRAAADEEVSLPAARMLQLYRRLVSTFRAELSSFERKQYVSLSHEPNKAMNLNSYVGLMGGSYVDEMTPVGRVLVPTRGTADLSVPDPDYVLTLDADSVLLPEYCVRLMILLEQSEHQRVGVAQTPYSAYPGSGTRLERIAGASTDLQHIVHQGMTHYDATFWVGANAILRKRALDDIVQVGYEGNWEIRRYIQDRTPIEDTESSVDLGIHGWELLNYPERLSYSSTPPDFGSLCIQRRRWANGGLLILSKLAHQSRARRGRAERNRFGELFLRVNYMASIFWSSICLLLLLAYPFNSELLSPLLVLIAAPYFIMMSTDLKACGYKRLDVMRVYGFNLILLPVNLAGGASSLLQLITGEKSTFKRTPKVRNRTTATPFFILAPCALIALAGYTMVRDYQLARWNNFSYAVVNTMLMLYALVAFIGITHAATDLWVHVRGLLRAPRRSKELRRKVAVADEITEPDAPEPETVDWRSVLHHGPVVTPGSAPVASTAPSSIVASFSSPGGPHVGGRAPTTIIGPDVGVGHPGDDYSFFTVFQPIVDLVAGTPVGFEALARFADGQPPARRLAEAAAAGIGLELDTALARAAVDGAAGMPKDLFLSVNVSPGLAGSATMLDVVLLDAPRRVVLELGAVDDTALREAVAALTVADRPGVELALDDAGAGYDSLARIEQMAPDFLKLDRSWLAGIETDQARQALIRIIVDFADQLGTTVIAQGIETGSQRSALRDAGVRLGQGFLLGRPAPLQPLPHVALPLLDRAGGHRVSEVGRTSVTS